MPIIRCFSALLAVLACLTFPLYSQPGLKYLPQIAIGEGSHARVGGDLDTLQTYWVRFSSSNDYGLTVIQSLRVGGEVLLPYGILPAEPCSRSGIIVAEDENLRAGLVILNQDLSNTLTCTLTLSEASQGRFVAETSEEISPFSHTAFFLEERLAYAPGDERGLVIDCDSGAILYSLLQDRDTGDVNAVGTTCAPLSE